MDSINEKLQNLVSSEQASKDEGRCGVSTNIKAHSINKDERINNVGAACPS